jgi:hypothetical protein
LKRLIVGALAVTFAACNGGGTGTSDSQRPVGPQAPAGPTGRITPQGPLGPLGHPGATEPQGVIGHGQQWGVGAARAADAGSPMDSFGAMPGQDFTGSQGSTGAAGESFVYVDANGTIVGPSMLTLSINGTGHGPADLSYGTVPGLFDSLGNIWCMSARGITTWSSCSSLFPYPSSGNIEQGYAPELFVRLNSAACVTVYLVPARARLTFDLPSGHASVKDVGVIPDWSGGQSYEDAACSVPCASNDYCSVLGDAPPSVGSYVLPTNPGLNLNLEAPGRNVIQPFHMEYR